MRDDFSAGTKELLSKRVGFTCSNPECDQATSGPQADPTGVVNIGVAAHISAASPGGARYEEALSTEQRTDSSNGIWLCQTCAKLIDNDSTLFSRDVLEGWKRALSQGGCGRPDSKQGFRQYFPAGLREGRATHAGASRRDA